MTQTVAILGATGNQGGSVLRALHATGKYKLIAVTRDTSSASSTKLKSKYPDVKLVEANLNDVESLKKAFEGVDVVFGVTLFWQPDIMDQVAAGNVDAEFNQGKNVADAAIAVSVKDIIFSTSYSMSELTGGKYTKAIHFDGKYKIEKYIRSKAAEIRGAFIQLGSYMENFVNFSRVSSEDNETIEFTFPAKPTAKLPLVDTANDTGGVVSHMLDHFDDFVGKTVEVSGGYYEAQEIARAFTEVTGKPARYVQTPFDAFNSVIMEQMFRGMDEFGYFGWKTDFLELNKQMSYKHTTPVEFWKNRGWTGPSQ
ncbi:hypothetical protein IW140_003385 [Coemansia sp. RSA 1813]|nr:hypothetical protein EV178_003203 [Coemansia sp. RSA 1646]KAJ1771010.1 hypothetical protein LPJ74_002701 [Coemansia sp. RSA 1843]KAJ2089250.1 hypothetical protein IW138_003570 [Coemansia sp. RSA 986]KAJ2215079.1 hypothetical protein EV179_002447 [Coemansia sp. RSA 487]KAJ2569020.1 hypothetical protein IW140_003385 [Coemansia sp. RSA 1813]